MPDIAWDLIDAAEKPLTIIYQEVKGIAHNAIAEDGSCAIRLPKDNFCQQLVQRLGKPLISTSANTSGTPTPQSFQDIEPSILSGVDYVVNLRQQEKMQEHTFFHHLAQKQWRNKNHPISEPGKRAQAPYLQNHHQGSRPTWSRNLCDWRIRARPHPRAPRT